MPAFMDHMADVATGSTELYRLRQLYTFPAFVKLSEDVDLHLTVPANASPDNCADKTHKQFWCHTKVSCWLSHLFYQEKRAEFHPKDRVAIESKLKKYATYFGITPQCDQIKREWAARHKTSADTLPDSAYAYVWHGENGTKERHLPLRSGMEVKAAAEYLVANRDAFPFAVRHVVARKILEKAAAFSALIPDQIEFLERQAGRGCGDVAEIVRSVQKRAYAVPADCGVTYDADDKPQGGVRAQFLKMAAEIASLPRQALLPTTLIKLAATLDQCDRTYGLTTQYGAGGLERPEDVVFSETFTKTARDAAHHVPTTTGKFYEKAAFKRLNLSDVEALFGTEFADLVRDPLGDVDVEKMAEQVATLPRPDAELLDGMLSDNGIVPVMHKAAASRKGFAAAEMEQIAATYGR